MKSGAASIMADTVIEALKEWNPWWFGKSPVLDELKGTERPKYGALVDSVDSKLITIITGVRRSGKSTLMYQMVDRLLKAGKRQEDIFFVNFEDRKLSNSSLDDIYSAYRENINPDKKAYIFFDEIHRKDGWETWIRKKYDLKENAKFVISGSCSYLLRKEYSTLLTGRNLTFVIFPLSFGEFLEFKGIDVDRNMFGKNLVMEQTKYSILKSLKEYMGLGGFPGVFLEKEEFKARMLKQYFDDIIYKDIIDRHRIRGGKVKDLAQMLITNFTGLVSLRKTRSTLNLSYDAIKDYLYIFEEVFLFFIANHFSYSISKQKKYPPKIYCIDNGLINAVSFRFTKNEGKLAENTVFVELKGRGKEVYYWKGKNEVDFVIKNDDQSLSAINVTYTDEIDEREKKGLMEFKRTFKSKVKELVIITKDLEDEKNGISYIPLWKWLLRQVS